MRLINTCSKCGAKDVQEKSHSKVGNTKFITLECGHTHIEQLVESKEKDTLILADKRELYPFQLEGFRFAERSNFRCLIADEMGLGKTIQAVASGSEHFESLKPILAVVKASLLYNWLREWINASGKIGMIIESKNEIIPGLGFYIISWDLLPRKLDYILSTIKPKTFILDECQMMKNHEAKRTQAIREAVRSNSSVAVSSLVRDVSGTMGRRMRMIANDLLSYHGLKDRFTLQFAILSPRVLGLTHCRSDKEGIIKGTITINKNHAEKDPESEVIETILHEIAHGITPGAGHSEIWKDTAKGIGSTGEVKGFSFCGGTEEITTIEEQKHIIALSGTPIKNNALEYFPVLNILRPEMFPDRKRFMNQELDWYWDAEKGKHKPAGLREPDKFLEKTSEFIIRRTRKEVLPDLPKIQRDYKFYQMGDVVTKAYNEKIQGLSNVMDNPHSKSFSTDLLAMLGMLRHITGLAKIEPVLEYVKEFLESHSESDNGGLEKLTIFHHHIDVGKILSTKLKEMGVGYKQIISAYDSAKREEIIKDFRENRNIRILIAPTLACGEGINLQFCHHAILMEREWNPANEEQAEGRFSRIGSEADSIEVMYPISTGTVDEFFTEIVEQKRQFVRESLEGTGGLDWNQTAVMTELANKVLDKWRLG